MHEEGHGAPPNTKHPRTHARLVFLGGHTPAGRRTRARRSCASSRRSASATCPPSSTPTCGKRPPRRRPSRSTEAYGREGLRDVSPSGRPTGISAHRMGKPQRRVLERDRCMERHDPREEGVGGGGSRGTRLVNYSCIYRMCPFQRREAIEDRAELCVLCVKHRNIMAVTINRNNTTPLPAILLWARVISYVCHMPVPLCNVCKEK